MQAYADCDVLHALERMWYHSLMLPGAPRGCQRGVETTQAPPLAKPPGLVE